MPQGNFELPQTPDVPWQDAEYKFDGAWMPDVDPALIGPTNFANLENLRYKDQGIAGVNGYTKINVDPIDGAGDNAALGDYPYIRNGAQLRSLNTQKSYVLAHALNSSDQGRVFVNRTAIGSQGNFDYSSNFWKDADNRIGGGANVRYPYFQDVETGLEGRFAKVPHGNLGYANSKETMIFGGDESQVSAAFLVDDAAGANPIDVTDRLNNSLTTSGNTVTVSTADQAFLLLMTTRPIQGLKIYIDSANAQTDTDLVVKYWTGSAWSADYVATDNTVSGGATLAQNGTVLFTNHTDNLAKPMHFEELFLYAYLVELDETTGTDATADLTRITCDTAFQPVKDIWDGVYRQAIQFQRLEGSSYSDYTLHVNAPSTETAPVGGDIKGMTTAEHFLIMFTEQMAAIRLTMVGSLVNSAAASTLKVSYWDGDGYTALTLGSHNYVDGTSDGTRPFGQTGLVSWTPPTDEQAKTQFSSFGYIYKFEVVTQDVAGSGAVIIDLVSGVPQQKIVKPFDFTAEFKNRMMLCSYSAGNQANRIDYSVTNAPDVYNGSDSSNDGAASLFFGGEEKITAARSLYNRFGSNVLAMFLVLKDSETYLLVGNDPSDFTIYPVSDSIGCPAPLTLVVDDITVGTEGNQSVTRNMAFWLSSAGPVMFDGGSISSITGIDNFFDPNSTEYLEWDNISRARGWMDNTYNEYNLLIPTTSGQEDNNRWLVYDLLRRKWYEKNTGVKAFPQAAWEVLSTEGERNVYGGIDTGYMMYLENGTSWDGSGITQRVKTGDFFPTQSIWDETVIRKIKLLTEKFESATATDVLDIYHHPNTIVTDTTDIVWAVAEEDGGVDVGFVDIGDPVWYTTAVSSINITQDVGGQRVLNVIIDANLKGWSHSFEFVITTTTIVNGFRPVIWGIEYRTEKKNNQASTG